MTNSNSMEDPNVALLVEFYSFLSRSGPFTDFHKDKEFLPRLMGWIGNDWQRMRTVLNLVHEQGMIVGIGHCCQMISGVADNCSHRNDMWRNDFLEHVKKIDNS